MDVLAAAAEHAAGSQESAPPMTEIQILMERHIPQGPFNWSLALGVVLAFLSQLVRLLVFQRFFFQAANVACRLLLTGSPMARVCRAPSARAYKRSACRAFPSSHTGRVCCGSTALQKPGGVACCSTSQVPSSASPHSPSCPISVAQPIFCNGLVLLACYSHFYLKEQASAQQQPHPPY